MNLSAREHVPLAPFTTLGIGGPARYFIRANSETLIQQAVDFAAERQIPLLVLGGGSNMLIADQGFPGAVLRVELAGLAWSDDGGEVRLRAGAGEDWDKVVAQAVERQLYGIECLSGIPGTVGGTPVQNVGAYGQEVAETVERVRTYDRQEHQWVEFERNACQFAYRTSLFNSTDRDRYIITWVDYRLLRHGVPCRRYAELDREFENASEPTLAMVRAAVRRIRARKAMLIEPGDSDSRSAGSFFKNPVISEDVFKDIQNKAGVIPPHYSASEGKLKTAAAWLIEHSGISKGFSIGPAGVSSKHTLALINKGGATAADVITVARTIRRRVEDRFGIRLAVEPVLVGFDDETTAEFRH